MKLKIIMGTITIALIILVVITSHLSADHEEFDLGNIKFEEGVVNIYYFYGDGCPRCAEQHAFFESIQEEFGQYFNLHKFEVWYSESNAQLMQQVAQELDIRVTGVPFTIIGEETFTGFASRMEQDMINAILEQAENDFDVMQIIKENN